MSEEGFETVSVGDDKPRTYDHEEARPRAYDPFGQDVAQASLIVQMKIYDVLMALLMDANPDVARDLDTLHTQGIILGQGPTFAQFMERTSQVQPDEDSASPE
jgi:hypothetical protein